MKRRFLAGKLCYLYETLASGILMDDLLVGTAADRYGFIQAKSKVDLSDKPDGEFASVIDQTVRQVADRDDAGITRPWSRKLHPSTDRLLLVTGSRSGSKINDLLHDVLNRAKDLAPGQPLSDAAVTDEQSKVLDTTAKVVRARLLAATGRAATETEILSVLALLPPWPKTPFNRPAVQSSPTCPPCRGVIGRPVATSSYGARNGITCFHAPECVSRSSSRS